jgi:ADP-ribosyl-[dinitrogen reductase] hydrolase
VRLPLSASARPATPLPNTYWVVPGQVLAGEYPGAPDRAESRLRLARLIDAGVGCFLDLTQPDELPPYHADLPLAIEYLRKPIADHGIPEVAQQMAEILQCLRQALSAHRVVYVHCRAGIGRTGTVAGCLLVERGLAGGAALAELNRLWQGSARSAQWPVVPETDEQSEYVRNWTPLGLAPDPEPERDPLLDPETLAAARGLRERFLGALLGLAVGDAVAAATQYKRPGKFAPVGDLLGGGPFDLPRGAWSDDTAMALCLAESLLGREGFDARDQVARYRRWQQHGHLSATGQCLGITASTARALARSQWRRQPFSGSHDPHALGPESLSRVAPVVMYFFGDRAAAIEYAGEAARATSQAPAVLTACRALAAALHAGLSGEPKNVMLERATSLLEAPEALGVIAAASAAALPAAAAVGIPDGGAAGPARRAGVTARSALAAALDAFARTDNFRDAVLAAANLGGNSDVMAGACGALAGAHYTASAVPTLWRNSLMKNDLLESFADRLLAHALLRL